jgi:ectoine hydroxylase-related dioxygenase (phytanoyl-CoA dioxygenase family)
MLLLSNIIHKEPRMTSAAAVSHPKMGLSDTELALYHEQGFFIRRTLANPALVARMRSETDNLHDEMARTQPSDVGVSWEDLPEGRPKRIKQLMHSEVVCPSINEFVRCDAVLDIVESVIGRDITLFHSKLLMKAAHDGTVTPWHQDYSYWKTPSNFPAYINCMVAIDPFTKENGCTQYIAGSHKGGLIEHERHSGISFGVYLPGYFQPRPEAIYAEMAPGDAIFFGSLIIHGSGGNNSPNSRRANTMAFAVTGNDNPKWCRGVLRGKPNT